MDLKGKTAVVTGVSKGIGLATVALLLEKGAKVAGWGRTAPAIQHPDFLFVTTDVQEFEQVQAAHQQTTEHFGQPVAVLVNNAGLGKQGKLEDMPLEQWHLMFNTNVHGLFYCTKVVLPGMRQLGQAHIINIASIAGLNGIETMSGYCATKHAVRGISHSLFKEVRNDGIKVSCVYPGSVNTNFFDDIPGMDAHQNMMRPEDIAQTVVGLLETHPNYLTVDVEVRPLKPKG